MIEDDIPPSNPLWNDTQSEIIPNFLYLGSQKGSEDKEWLLSKGIKKIVSVCESLNRFEGDFEYLKIMVNDTITQNIDRYFPSSNEFIENARKTNSPVFIHCFSGISRSAAFVIAYLIEHKKMTLSDAIDFVKRKRSFVNINPNFYKQLIDFEILFHGRPSIRMKEISRDSFTIEKILEEEIIHSEKKKRKREKKLMREEKKKKKEKKTGTLKLKQSGKKMEEEKKIVKKDKFCW